MLFFVNRLDKLKKSAAKIITYALILYVIINLTVPQTSWSQNSKDIGTDCQCVVFRLDDLQDFYLNKPQIAVMDLFLQKNQSLSLALILNALGNDTTVIAKIREGYKTNKFELTSHGWNHENFSKLNEQEQIDLLSKANDKMHSLFRMYPTVFVPPFYEFNNSTIDAARHVGIKIISSLDKFYEGRNQSALITDGKNSNHEVTDDIFHFPSTLQYSYTDGMRWNTYSVNQSLRIIHDSILSHGYAVVTLHPQGFANVIKGNLTNSVNVTQINNLVQIMDSVIDDNIHTSFFYKLGRIFNTGDASSEG